VQGRVPSPGAQIAQPSQIWRMAWHDVCAMLNAEMPTCINMRAFHLLAHITHAWTALFSSTSSWSASAICSSPALLRDRLITSIVSASAVSSSRNENLAARRGEGGAQLRSLLTSSPPPEDSTLPSTWTIIVSTLICALAARSASAAVLASLALEPLGLTRSDCMRSLSG
jgi:hypothetical protein